MSKFAGRIVGVLALQGDYERHQVQIEDLGATSVLVRLPGDLAMIDSLILPGGETTTMNILLDKHHLRAPLVEFCRTHPVYGTCAGMILMSQNIEDNISGVNPLKLMDIDVLRNGYGRQVFSFEEPILASLGNGRVELTATFIRAPRVTRLGKEIEVLATYKDSPVLIRQGQLLASSFHAELDEDTRLLEYFLMKLA